MTRKVEVGFVKYHYVEVVVPEDYPEDIDDWSNEQLAKIQQEAKSNLPYGDWGWNIDDDFEMELSND